MEPRSIADVKLLRDLPASIALQGSGFVSARVIGATPVGLAAPAREDPLAAWDPRNDLCSLIMQAQQERDRTVQTESLIAARCTQQLSVFSYSENHPAETHGDPCMLWQALRR